MKREKEKEREMRESTRTTTKGDKGSTRVDEGRRGETRRLELNEPAELVASDAKDRRERRTTMAGVRGGSHDERASRRKGESGSEGSERTGGERPAGRREGRASPAPTPPTVNSPI